MSKVENLVNVLKGHKVYIQTHNFPDPDAIAAAYGLQRLLERYSIITRIVYDGNLDKITGIRLVEYFNINLLQAKLVQDMDSEDYIVIVDAQKYNKNCTNLIGTEVACIDHHPVVTQCDEYIYSDLRIVGSCSSIIAEYYFDAGIEPYIKEATVLLYGIKMDTNDLNRGVSELDVKMYYKLFPYADQRLLEKLSLNSIEFSDLKAYGAAINNISLHKNIGFATIPFDCPDGLIAIISDFILALDLVEFSVVYSTRSNGYKFSVRSELEKLDSGKIVRAALARIGESSGGGHAFMAGGFLSLDAVNSISGDVRKTIEEAFINEIEDESK